MTQELNDIGFVQVSASTIKQHLISFFMMQSKGAEASTANSHRSDIRDNEGSITITQNNLPQNKLSNLYDMVATGIAALLKANQATLITESNSSMYSRAKTIQFEDENEEDMDNSLYLQMNQRIEAMTNKDTQFLHIVVASTDDECSDA